MKIRAIRAPYEKVAAMPAEEHFVPMKPSLFFRTLIIKVVVSSTENSMITKKFQNTQNKKS